VKKIAVTTLYNKSINYGGNLQAYAVVKTLEHVGVESEQICLSVTVYQNNKTLLKKIFNNPKRAFEKLFNYFSIKKEELKTNVLVKRSKAFYNFNQEVIPHSKKVYNNENIKSCIKDYDAFITGSDQVWNMAWYNPAYFLDFVPSDKPKISYAASIARDSLTDEQKEIFKKHLKDFKAISVREPSAKELIKDLSPVEPEVVLDPTLLLSREEWDEVCSERKIDRDYLFCYFLGENKKERKIAKEFAKKRNLKLVTIPHAAGGINLVDRKFGDEKIYDASPQDFISLIKNAKYVFTDSFHAVVFSNIYQKQYFVFNRNKSGQMSSRITDITKLFNQTERFCAGKDKENLTYVESLVDIDYSLPNDKFEELKKKSLDFLDRNLKDIKESKKEYKKIEIKDKWDCSGCSACVGVCPKKCITMVKDEEGFLYPNIDDSKCIDCGLCSKICPINSPLQLKKERPKSYAVISKDEEIRKNSSSGGVFTHIANYVVDNGGVVFGAKFNEKFEVTHDFATDREGIKAFQGSKYVQSKIGDCYIKAKEFLEDGRLVLFSGTPCQIGGLKAFLNKDYDNLITQDLICHGAPSPLAWDKHLEFRTALAGASARRISSRHKKYGWKRFSVSFLFENDTEYLCQHPSDPYMRAFLDNLCLRPSCYNCAFKGVNRVSDITLADFWGVQKIMPEMYDDKGTSLVLIHSDKGSRILEKIQEQLVVKEAPFIQAISANSALIESVREPVKRKQFMLDLQSKDFKFLKKKYLKRTFKSKLRGFLGKVKRKLLG